MCSFECRISANIIHSSLLTWRNFRLKHIKDRIQNVQNIKSSEISSRIFETYKNAVRSYGCHIYNTAGFMAMTKMCPCTSEHNGLPHRKYVLCCCNKFPIIFLPSQEANEETKNMCPTIRFHVYRNVSWCTVHVQRS